MLISTQATALSEEIEMNWSVAQKNKGYWPYVERNNDLGFTIQSSVSQDKAEKDARIIAAAPKMLKTLEMLMELDDNLKKQLSNYEWGKQILDNAENILSEVRG